MKYSLIIKIDLKSYLLLNPKYFHIVLQHFIYLIMQLNQQFKLIDHNLPKIINFII